MLVAVAPTGKVVHGCMVWTFVCDCGGTRLASTGTMNRIKHCGCQTRKRHGEGHSNKTKEYRAWSSMKERCFKKTHHAYPNYGGRGITVCDSWKDSYQQFLEDMGRAPAGFSLDRIDVNGNYEPGNVRWADSKTQQSNRRNNRFIEYLGKLIPVTVFAELHGLKRNEVYHYLKVKALLENAHG